MECWTWPDAKGSTGQPKKQTQTTTPTSTESAAANSARKFNWIRDKDGLASLFPKSRIMLYNYASAWTGSLKVRATMRSICTVLLEDLNQKRQAGMEATRPLVFIGHSMGGVVIAKVRSTAYSLHIMIVLTISRHCVWRRLSKNGNPF